MTIKLLSLVYKKRLQKLSICRGKNKLRLWSKRKSIDSFFITLFDNILSMKIKFDKRGKLVHIYHRSIGTFDNAIKHGLSQKSGYLDIGPLNQQSS